MTYCVGFKYKKSVYLFADSAITNISAQPGAEMTSFGEAPYVANFKTVDERALKIVSVGSDCIIAIAGDSKRAFDCVESFRMGYDSAIAIPDLLHSLSLSLDPHASEHFEYLVARSNDQSQELWQWSSHPEAVPLPIADFSHIGSLTSWHSDVTRLVSNLMRSGNIDETRLLTVITSLIQSYGLRDVLLEQGVGGTIVGVQVSPLGLRWLPDTNYVIHDYSLSSIQLVSIYCRGGGVAVRSSFTQDTRVFLAGISHDSANDWVDRWKNEIGLGFDQCAAQMWIFLGTSALTIFIVDSEFPVVETECCKITTLNTGSYDLAINDVLKSALALPIMDQGDGSLPIRLTYTTAHNCIKQASYMVGRK